MQLLEIQSHRRGAFFGREAVTDSKLLWRANLYIDEGTGDWNDEHPWNSPDNEWNWEYDYKEDKDSFTWTAGSSGSRYTETFTGLAQGDGKQVLNIAPSTWHGQDYDDRSTNTEIEKSLIYCWGLTSSPFQYNEELLTLSEIIKEHFKTQKDIFVEENPEEEIPQYLEKMAEWDETIAPRYRKDGTNDNEPTWENYTGYSDTDLPAARLSLNDKYDDTTYYSEYPYTADNAIGVDCGGLVYMAASYEGNDYISPMDEGLRWFYEVDGNENLTLIARKNARYLDEAGDWQYPNLKYIKPGDIFYWDGYHVAIVTKIEGYIDGTSEDELSKIHLIEATYGVENRLSFGNVINDRTLSDYNENKDWVIGRIKEE